MPLCLWYVSCSNANDAEPGKPGADCEASPSHSPSIRDLHSSFLHTGARRGTCPCNQDRDQCRLRCVEVGKCIVESRALPAASVLLCRRSCSLNVSFLAKKEVEKGNSILEISSASFRFLHTPTSPRNRFIGERVYAGEMFSRLLSQ